MKNKGEYTLVIDVDGDYIPLQICGDGKLYITIPMTEEEILKQELIDTSKLGKLLYVKMVKK